MTQRHDIFISGGGIAGLTAAAALSELGYSVVLADPAPADPGTPDLRSTAYLQPAKALFERVGLWEKLSQDATPLKTLRVIDTAGMPPALQTERAFQSSDLSEDPFGWNIPNWRARKVLIDSLAERVDLRLGTGFKSILTRESEARVTLTDGTGVRAKLAIGADGRLSPLRDALGIGVQTRRYGQKALAFSVTHDIPHDDISTEIYHRGGAFTLVPLPDHESKPASSVVWMEDGRTALTLAELPEQEFDARATERSVGILGKLKRTGGIGHWPVVTQTADSLVAERCLLLAEAAHVMPPIGAQGLNTSLQDIAALISCLRAHPGDPGAAPVMGGYAKARAKDIALRAKTIDLFNRICRSDAPPVQALRSAGLKLVHDIKPVRHAIMSAGLGG